MLDIEIEKRLNACLDRVDRGPDWKRAARSAVPLFVTEVKKIIQEEVQKVRTKLLNQGARL
jgi:hypothetical protein